MAYLLRHKKEDLKVLADELGLEVNSRHKVVDLKEMILNSGVDDESVKLMLEVIVEERKEEEDRELELEELRRQIYIRNTETIEGRRSPRCHYCGSFNHLRPQCPSFLKKSITSLPVNPVVNDGFSEEVLPYPSEGEVNGLPTKILRDTDATIDVSREMIEPELSTGEKVLIEQPLSNVFNSLPLSYVQLEEDFEVIKAKAAVIPDESCQDKYTGNTRTARLIEVEQGTLEKPHLLDKIEKKTESELKVFEANSESKKDDSQMQGTVPQDCEETSNSKVECLLTNHHMESPCDVFEKHDVQLLDISTPAETNRSNQEQDDKFVVEQSFVGLKFELPFINNAKISTIEDNNHRQGRTPEVIHHSCDLDSSSLHESRNALDQDANIIDFNFELSFFDISIDEISSSTSMMTKSQLPDDELADGKNNSISLKGFDYSSQKSSFISNTESAKHVDLVTLDNLESILYLESADVSERKVTTNETCNDEYENSIWLKEKHIDSSVPYVPCFGRPIT